MEQEKVKQKLLSENRIDIFSVLFRLVLWWKILYGLAKVVFALILLRLFAIDPANIFYKFMAHELIEDPDDLFIRLATPLVNYLSSSTTFFVALYLLFWGVVDDIFLSINILRRKLWAFPTALILIGLFIPYELYRLFHTNSLVLGFVIVMDVFIFWTIAHEYKKLKHKNLS